MVNVTDLTSFSEHVNVILTTNCSILKYNVHVCVTQLYRHANNAQQSRGSNDPLSALTL